MGNKNTHFLMVEKGGSREMQGLLLRWPCMAADAPATLRWAELVRVVAAARQLRLVDSRIDKTVAVCLSAPAHATNWHCGNESLTA